jgi:hypothetical protein
MPLQRGDESNLAGSLIMEKNRDPITACCVNAEGMLCIRSEKKEE